MIRIEIVPFRERSGAIILTVKANIDGEEFTYQKAMHQPDFESLLEIVMREATSAIKARALVTIKEYIEEG